MPIDSTTQLGHGVCVFRPELVNIYGAVIGHETRIGPFVEIQRGAVIGSRCKIQSHTFIPEGVTVEDEVFIGHGVMFTNDRWPRAVDAEGSMIGEGGWSCSPTLVKRRAVIGSGAVLLPIVVGESAFIGAGAVVTKDIPDHAIAFGNPARIVGDIRDRQTLP